MSVSDPKSDLQRYLQRGRKALVWKLDGLSEYDVRRPLVPTGTNLLGLIKHVAAVEAGYLGQTFGRPFGELLPGFEPGAAPNADMWARPDETREDILDLYRRVWSHSDETIRCLDLNAQGHVAHWPASWNPVTLHQIVVAVISETQRHAGHADIVRELIDGSVGFRADYASVPAEGPEWWAEYRNRLELAAREADRSGEFN